MQKPLWLSSKFKLDISTYNPRIKNIDKDFCGKLGQPEATKTKLKPKVPKMDMSHFGKL